VDTSGFYRLREGDVLQVSVWGEEGLEREVRVLPDGSITFPLAGRVEVVGLTTSEVERRVGEKLKDFIPEPTVTVVITATEGSLVYVAGKVNRPGPIPFRGPMTVMQALSMAGGPGTFADEDDIVVVRTTPHGEEILPVNYDDLIEGDDLSTNILLKAGDTILVP
jgi:polysaccharide export outer membrane protein